MYKATTNFCPQQMERTKRPDRRREEEAQLAGFQVPYTKSLRMSTVSTSQHWPLLPGLINLVTHTLPTLSLDSSTFPSPLGSQVPREETGQGATSTYVTSMITHKKLVFAGCYLLKIVFLSLPHPCWQKGLSQQFFSQMDEIISFGDSTSYASLIKAQALLGHQAAGLLQPQAAWCRPCTAQSTE